MYFLCWKTFLLLFRGWLDHFSCPWGFFAKFALAFLTREEGRAGLLCSHLKVDSVLRREVKCSAIAVKRGLEYFRHSASVKVKKQVSQPSKKARLLLLEQLLGLCCPWSVPVVEKRLHPQYGMEWFQTAHEAERPQGLASPYLVYIFKLVSLLWNAKPDIDIGLLKLNWLEEATDMKDLYFAGKGLGCRLVPTLSLVKYRMQQTAIVPDLKGQKSSEVLALVFRIAGWMK